MTAKRPMDMSMPAIRRMIELNRGGHKVSSDEEIMRLWNHLPQDIRAKYALSVSELNKKSES